MDVVDNIMATINVNENMVNSKEFMRAFNLHFGACENLIAVHAKSSKRTQKPEEPIDIFIQDDLIMLIEECEYSPLKRNSGTESLQKEKFSSLYLLSKLYCNCYCCHL